VGYHQLYLLHQYSPGEPEIQHRYHQKPAQHSPNKHPHQYISNNKFCTRYFYQTLNICICMYYVLSMYYVSKPM
jgi:hypothetical protein